MGVRRALFIAPLYDGQIFTPVPGGRRVGAELRRLLVDFGGYDFHELIGNVTKPALRRKLSEFFASTGSLLFYFYGHGHMQGPNMGVLATTDAVADDYGILMQELGGWSNLSPASEVISILECCSAGDALFPLNDELKRFKEGYLSRPGRAILAACSQHQNAWVETHGSSPGLGVFSRLVLEGLSGGAQPSISSEISASDLGRFVSAKNVSWRQEPVQGNTETHSFSCHIVTGPTRRIERQVDRKDDDPTTSCLFLGLPFKPSNIFVGREAEIRNIKSMVIDSDKPLAVSAAIEGLGGVGKTELVLQLLNDKDIVQAFRTILWFDASAPIAPQWESVAGALSTAFNADEYRSSLANVWATLQQRGRTLLVLDNAEDWEALRPQTPQNIATIVTSRVKDFGGSRFLHAELGVLPRDAALDLLERLAPHTRGDPEIQTLLDLLDGHALALEIAGNHIRESNTASEYVELFKKEDTEITQDKIGHSRHQTTVDACLRVTWKSLSDKSRLLWRKASLFAPVSAHRDLLKVTFAYRGDYELHEIRDISRADLSAATGDGSKFTQAYSALRRFHVIARVEGTSGERWAMHRLVRDFGRRRVLEIDRVLHLGAFSEWLRKPDLPVKPEISHFVVAILDSARDGSRYMEMRRAQVLSRGFSPRRYDYQSIMKELGEELDDPQALKLISNGLRDENDDVRISSMQLLERAKPSEQLLLGLSGALADPTDTVRDKAVTTLGHHGGDRIADYMSSFLETGAPLLRFSAIRVLALLKADKARGIVERYVDDPQLDVAEHALLHSCSQTTSPATILKALRFAEQLPKDARPEWIGRLLANPRASTIKHLRAIQSNPEFLNEILDVLAKDASFPSDRFWELCTGVRSQTLTELALRRVKFRDAKAEHILVDGFKGSRGALRTQILVGLAEFGGETGFGIALLEVSRRGRLPAVEPHLQKNALMKCPEIIEPIRQANPQAYALYCLLACKANNGGLDDQVLAAATIASLPERVELLDCVMRLKPARALAILSGWLEDDCATVAVLDAILKIVEGSPDLAHLVAGRAGLSVELVRALCPPYVCTAKELENVQLDGLPEPVVTRLFWSFVRARTKMPLPLLAKAIEQGTWEIKYKAATILGRMKNSSSIDMLLNMIEEQDSFAAVRAEACKALGWLRDPRTLPILERVSKSDENAAVQAEARKSLLRFSGVGG